MLYNIPETSIFILFLNYYKNKNNNIDIYYVLRFLVPWLIRLNITHKNFDNKYEDVKEHKQILLPELYLFMYDFIDKYKENQLSIDIFIHHTLTIYLIIMNMVFSNSKNEDIKKILGLYQGVNILNIHNSGDIFIRLPKAIIKYDKLIGKVSGIFGIIYWIYTRNYIQYKNLIQFQRDSKDINKKIINTVEKKMIFLYIIGIFYTLKVLYYFRKIVINN